ncbi:MAG: hypothetical protein IJV35_06340 [Neisseriaceae bacterium]|nr:hypothetical protein [Neisseriaceae bacterium]
MNTAVTTPLALCFVLSDKIRLPRLAFRQGSLLTRFKFQAAHFVIASRQTGVSGFTASFTPVSLRDCVSNRGNPIKLYKV